LTRQLRLAFGIKTDVGRKRERNQDNVTKLVPDDAKVLEERGALFVVCDGMGGHAAGEVAAELGVNTIREVYFASEGTDVITSIAQAIKAANDAIYSLARSHTEYGGMGTTCVTLVIAGGRAYIVNIGDSRAYIIRDGEMRQVTQDHSWVGEQVRMGLLTEEQARVHAHRNVITRSLGTLPNITADLFVESLRDGDRVMLCSDGLHGYVEEKALMQEVVTQESPEIAVNNLIDMANANGGPDNISAIVVDVLEVPEVTGPIPLPANTVDAIEEGTTQPLPVPTQVTPAATAIAASVAAPLKSAPARAARPSRAPRKGGFLLTLRLLEIVALLAVIAGGWYFGFGPPATQRAANQQAQTRLSNARQIIQQANSQTPTVALQSLSQARAIVLTEVNNKTLDLSLRAQAQTLLDQELAPAVQQALQRYNSAAHITQTTISSAVAFTINCVTPTEKTPSPITATSGLAPISAPTGKPAIISGRQLIFFISGGALYEALIPVNAQNTPVTGTSVCAPITIKGASAYLSLVSYGDSVFVLTQLAAGGYNILKVTPGALSATGAPTTKAIIYLAVPTTKQTPTHLAIYGRTVYVSYAIGSTSFGVWYFSGLPKSKPQAIGLPAAVTSLLAVNNSLYMLLADGTLGQLDTAHVFISLPVTATLPATATPPETYTAATPVPTPQSSAVAATPTPTIGATFGPGAQLIGDPLNATQFLVSDPRTQRIIQLVTAANGPGVGLVGQYVYGASPTNVGDIAMTGFDSTLNAYVWSNAQLVTFTLPVATS
jgi:serine/threonine protein phosphatase PrpC